MADYVIDGSDRVLGRIGSHVAKQLLYGKSVVLLNAERISISGSQAGLITKYKRLVELKDKANPEHSPYWSRRPDLFVKRVIRGMLPYKMPRGKAAFKNLRVYIGFPEEFKNAQLAVVESKRPSEIYQAVMTVGELSRKLGYRG
jgi:large subunit ribosomal protein L13